MDDLELNTLHRFKKHSPGLLLQEHDHCEVPAGCGGVVLRWLNPAEEAYLSLTLYTPGGADLYLDGKQVYSSIFSVAMGKHVLALHLRDSAAFLLAVQQNSEPRQKLLFLSQSDNSWRASQIEPAKNWTDLDFAEEWEPLGVCKLKDKGWLREEAEKLGAQPLGRAGAGPPPQGLPPEAEFIHAFRRDLRVQYCENRTNRASDWHNHYYEAIGEMAWPGRPDREPGSHGYDLKLVVAVDYNEAVEFCQRSQTCLPSEKQWEKAARGGLIGQIYAWGNQPPDHETCDFHRFSQFSVRPFRQFPANGYGLYAMCGGVWEWTSTRYDALAYRCQAPLKAAKQYVIRGGSWADCAEAVTVSFRGSRAPEERPSPNIGFRVCLPGPQGGIWNKIRESLRKLGIG